MKRLVTLLVLLVSLAAGTASAAPIGVSFDTFGPFPIATFGGSGIPTDWVAVTTFIDSGNTITLALSATQRFTNPALTNDGAGTFSAGTGADVLSAPSAACPAGVCAKWNFDFYVSSTGGNYAYDLLYDFDPASGTDQSALGRIQLTSSGALTMQNSWNLGFGFLGTTAGVVTRPAFAGPFSPGAAGEYSFGIIARNAAGLELDRVAIEVATVPEPASMLLLGTGLAGLVARARRKARAKTRVN